MLRDRFFPMSQPPEELRRSEAKAVEWILEACAMAQAYPDDPEIPRIATRVFNTSREIISDVARINQSQRRQFQLRRRQ